jgi:hypothetical protein
MQIICITQQLIFFVYTYTLYTLYTIGQCVECLGVRVGMTSAQEENELVLLCSAFFATGAENELLPSIEANAPCKTTTAWKISISTLVEFHAHSTRVNLRGLNI